MFLGVKLKEEFALCNFAVLDATYFPPATLEQVQRVFFLSENNRLAIDNES